MARISLECLYGNGVFKETLVRAITDGRLSHVYLFEGVQGSGKATAAFLSAATLCCTSEEVRPCMQCPTCRKILSAQSPDLSVIGLDALPFDGHDPAKPTEKPRSIGVDAIRALRSDAYILPNDLEYKLYIIGHADRMTVQAQNALLKILEEPPTGAVFFLLCENRAALLPTVLSRVQRLNMEQFSDDALYALLCRYDREASMLSAHDDALLRLYVRLADGAYGRALFYVHAQKKELAQDEAYAAHEGAMQCLALLFADSYSDDSPVLRGGEGVLERPSLTSVAARITSLLPGKDGAENRSRLRALTGALCVAVRDLTMCACGVEGQLLFYPSHEQPAVLAARCRAKTLSDTGRALCVLLEDMDANPNVGMLTRSLAGVLMGLRR